MEELDDTFESIDENDDDGVSVRCHGEEEAAANAPEVAEDREDDTEAVGADVAEATQEEAPAWTLASVSAFVMRRELLPLLLSATTPALLLVLVILDSPPVGIDWLPLLLRILGLLLSLMMLLVWRLFSVQPLSRAFLIAQVVGEGGVDEVEEAEE